MPTCTEGHETVADDYCDVCGSPVTAPGAQAVSSAAGGETLSGVSGAGRRPIL